MSTMSFKYVRNSVDQSMSLHRKVIGYKTRTVSGLVCKDELVKNMTIEICYEATKTNL